MTVSHCRCGTQTTGAHGQKERSTKHHEQRSLLESNGIQRSKERERRRHRASLTTATLAAPPPPHRHHGQHIPQKVPNPYLSARGCRWRLAQDDGRGSCDDVCIDGVHRQMRSCAPVHRIPENCCIQLQGCLPRPFSAIAHP